MSHPFLILPSLLSADFARLGEEAKTVLAAGGDMLHFDVMDNHYVPNLTVGPLVCQALRRYGIEAPIDVHLMTEHVDTLIPSFAKAGANHITFHPEASQHIDRSLALIRDHGCKAGLALNPATSWQVLEFVLDKLDMVLVMTVNPGFGGQTFMPAMLKKITQIREFLNQCGYAHVRIAVDGGIKADTIQPAANAGADMFVAGSAIFDTDNYQRAIEQLRHALNASTA